MKLKLFSIQPSSSCSRSKPLLNKLRGTKRLTVYLVLCLVFRMASTRHRGADRRLLTMRNLIDRCQTWVASLSSMRLLVKRTTRHLPG